MEMGPSRSGDRCEGGKHAEQNLNNRVKRYRNDVQTSQSEVALMSLPELESRTPVPALELSHDSIVNNMKWTKS